ncbi:hypothetical protein GA0070615_5326 [Micromonospora aurantiaca]|nr:hypothetical protein GA0070615_5326 [Micromonospora aurantiaca]
MPRHTDPDRARKESRKRARRAYEAARRADAAQGRTPVTAESAQVAERADVFAVVDEVDGTRIYRYVGEPIARPPRPRPADL